MRVSNEDRAFEQRGDFDKKLYFLCHKMLLEEYRSPTEHLYDTSRCFLSSLFESLLNFTKERKSYRFGSMLK